MKYHIAKIIFGSLPYLGSFIFSALFFPKILSGIVIGSVTAILSRSLVDATESYFEVKNIEYRGLTKEKPKESFEGKDVE